MAQSDAIMDYSNNGHYSTADKASDVLAVWEANKDNAVNDRHDHVWSGDPTAAPSTPLSGWDDGMWKRLPLWLCAHDPSYQLPECNAAHTMIRDIKKTFNLPNQGTDEEWADTYTDYAATNLQNGESAVFTYVSKNVASYPMSLSKPSMVSESNSDVGYPGHGLGAGKNIKCGLVIGLQGWNLDVGVGRGMSVTVRPNDANITTYNNHYKALRDANTPAADYTDPPAAGAEYVVEGNILLVNYENQWRGTTMNTDTDKIYLCITWSSHTYAQIKTIMDAAIA
jgi:hypothetical protein